MPKNLVPVAEYTGNVTVPTGGDARTALSLETPLQKLTDRVAYAKAQIDLTNTYAAYQLSGASVAHGAKWTLTELYNQSGFSLASNEIVFPAIGKYLVWLKLSVAASDTTNPLNLGASLVSNGSTVDECIAKRFSGTAGDSVYPATSYILDVTDLSTKHLHFTAYGAGNITLAGSASRVVVRRLP